MILNAKGEPYRRLTLMEIAQDARPSLLPMIEALSKKNPMLQGAPWREPIRLLDQFGRPIWRDHES